MLPEDDSDWGRFALRHADEAILVCDPGTTIRWASPSLKTTLGWAPEDVVGLTWTFDKEHVPSAATGLLARAVGSGADRCDVRLRCLLRDGSRVWVDASVRLVAAGKGEVDSLVVSLRDPAGLGESERALQEAESRYQLLADNADNVVTWSDTEGTIRYASPSVRRALLRDPESMVGRPALDLFIEEDQPIVRHAQEVVSSGQPASFQGRARMPQGASKLFEVLLTPTFDDRGRLIGRSSGWRDVQAEHAAIEALVHETEYDALTGLAKRGIALVRISQILEARRGEDWALLCVGVDNLTSVNQAFTYVGGDEVLRIVAARLVEAVGASRRVARVAGDEFAIMLTDATTPTRAAQAAEMILEAVRGPVRIGEASVEVTACIGIAMGSGEGSEALLRDATAAMRQASSRGSDRWEFLDGDVGSRTRELLKTQGELTRGLQVGEIRAWLMPIVCFPDGRVCAYEALGRWVRPDGTVWSPIDFLKAVERTSLIVKVDREILRQVTHLLPRLPADVHVAVNVSGPTLMSGHLREWVEEELADAGVEAHRLHLEVTENTLFEGSGRIVNEMDAIADLGCTWWVDDFGTGYSSIAHLRDLPIGGLKLDKSYSAEVTVEDSRGARLAQGLCSLAQGLGLVTVAEGVETLVQSQVLQAQGWQMGQGYLFGKAVPPEDILGNGPSATPLTDS